MRSRHIFAFTLVWACGSDGSDPPGIPCGPNGECPSGFVCDPLDQQCYREGQNGAPDAGALDTELIDVPPALSNAAEVTFTFRADGADGFECSLDGVPFSPCTSPLAVTVDEGDHVFLVRAVRAGEADPTPARHEWTSDQTAPDTTLTLVPPSVTNTGEAEIAFVGSEPDVIFYCRLDGGGWEPCASPRRFVGLAAGSHRADVAAEDAAGNRDPEPAGATWTIVFTGPTIAIAGTPADGAVTADANARFELSFVDVEEANGGSFECAADAAALAPCTSPVAVTFAGDGAHRFAARGLDRFGNAGPAVERTFTLDTIPPIVVVSGTPADGTVTGSTSTDFTWAFQPEEVGGRFECSLSGPGGDEAFDAAGCRNRTGLGDGGYRFSVRGQDAAGNPSQIAAVSWTVDNQGPVAVLAGTPANGSATNVASTSFTWSFAPAEPATTTFECSTDGGAWGMCANGSYPDGGHTFSVRGRDAAGNVGAAATVSWTVDTQKPTATFDAADPANGSVSNDATWYLSFASNEPGVTFECLLDGARLVSPCFDDSTHTMTDGVKTAVVRAIDRAGNVGDWSAQVSYTLDTRGPVITITERPANHSGLRPWRVSWTTNETATFQCTYFSSPVPCTPGPATAGTASGTETGCNSQHFGVRATDALGNVSSASVTWQACL